MKTRIPMYKCFNLILEWWNGEEQFNVLNGITFKNLYGAVAYYKVDYYNTNVCEHQSIIVKVNRETMEVGINNEM